ncbi:hypothetical protein QTP88_001535 [Uroleucon formosanum]
MPRLAKRQKNRDNIPTKDPEEYFRITLFLPFLDLFVQQLNDRFVNHQNIISGFQMFVKSSEFDEEKLRELVEFYANDVDDFDRVKSETILWNRYLTDSNKQYNSVIQILNECNPDLFPNIYKLLQTLITLPITSCEAERSFSTLKRIKSYLRNSTSERRLNGLAALNIHYEVSVTPEETQQLPITVPILLSSSIDECFTPVNAVGIRSTAHALGLVIVRDSPPNKKMSNTIDIEQWLEEDEDELIDGNDIDSEDDDYESEVGSDDVGPILQNKYFFGKDKTRWNKQAPTSTHRTRSHNIIVHLPGPKSIAKNMKTHLECFFLFFDEVVINIIVKSTNIKISFVKENYERARDARETDDVEIKAFIGILILAGVSKSSRQNIFNLFDDSKGTRLETVYLTMNVQRFRFLVRNLRFDDFTNRSERSEIDKLAPIRELFEVVVQHFQNNFIPSEYLTLDEQLIAFRGRCLFRQYIPNKPARYGIKIFALVDVKNAYTFNLEVYARQQPNGSYKMNNSAESVVKRMVQPVEGTKKNITMDNWFTSHSVVKYLLTEKQLTVVGNLRKNKTCIPKEFSISKNREINSSLFGFEKDCTITSYVPKKK